MDLDLDLDPNPAPDTYLYYQSIFLGTREQRSQVSTAADGITTNCTIGVSITSCVPLRGIKSDDSEMT
jgi:hypothetical protein